jgi:cytochrome c5
MKKTVFIILATVLAAGAYAAQSGSNIFYSKCTSCHGSALSLNKKKSTQQWEDTVRRMTKHGLSISSSETKAVAEFLSGGK